jgi:hypothetical protein
VVEIALDQRAAPQREPVDRQASAERERTWSVHPRGKVKPVKNAQAPASPSLTDQARVKAFMSGQNMADYCRDTKIVEGDESGQYRSGGSWLYTSVLAEGVLKTDARLVSSKHDRAFHNR